MKLIAAVDKNWAIGNKGQLLVSIPQDQKMFRDETMGKVIVMTDEEEMMLPWKLAEIIRRDGVTITQSTPSRVQMWLSNEAFCAAAPALEMMIYGGEVVTEALLPCAPCAAAAASRCAFAASLALISSMLTASSTFSSTST